MATSATYNRRQPGRGSFLPCPRGCGPDASFFLAQQNNVHPGPRECVVGWRPSDLQGFGYPVLSCSKFTYQCSYCRFEFCFFHIATIFDGWTAEPPQLRPAPQFGQLRAAEMTSFVVRPGQSELDNPGPEDPWFPTSNAQPVAAAPYPELPPVSGDNFPRSIWLENQAGSSSSCHPGVQMAHPFAQNAAHSPASSSTMRGSAISDSSQPFTHPAADIRQWPERDGGASQHPPQIHEQHVQDVERAQSSRLQNQMPSHHQSARTLEAWGGERFREKPYDGWKYILFRKFHGPDIPDQLRVKVCEKCSRSAASCPFEHVPQHVLDRPSEQLIEHLRLCPEPWKIFPRVPWLFPRYQRAQPERTPLQPSQSDATNH